MSSRFPNFGRPASYDAISKYASNAKRWPFSFPLRSPASPDIVFFDLETTVPTSTARDMRIVDFGAIVVDPVTLAIKQSVSQLIYNEAISPKSTAINRISADEARPHGGFAAHADAIFAVLDGRVWAGHNIVRFDIPRLCHEFGLLGRPMPKCAGVIDTFAVFAAWEYDRVMGDASSGGGKLKLDTLGKWFGHGQEAHRANMDALESFRVLLAGCASACFSTLVQKIPENSDPSSYFGIDDACTRAVYYPPPLQSGETDAPAARPKTTPFEVASTGTVVPVPVTYTTPPTVRAMPDANVSKYFGKTNRARAPLSGRADVTIGDMLLAPPLFVAPRVLATMTETRSIDDPSVPPAPPGSFAGGAPGSAIAAAALSWKLARDDFESLKSAMRTANVPYPIPSRILDVAIHIGYKKDVNLYGTYVVSPQARDPVYVEGTSLMSRDRPGAPPNFRTFRFDRFVWSRLAILVPE